MPRTAWLLTPLLLLAQVSAAGRPAPAAVAGWAAYTPEVTPPLVAAAYPGAGARLVRASQFTAGTDLSAAVGALITAWTGEQPRLFVRFTPGGRDLLAVSSDGLKVTAVRLSTASSPPLAFEVTLTAARAPNPDFTAIPDQAAFWDGRLPVTEAAFSDAPCPEGIDLASNGLTVTTPANFPAPAGRKWVPFLHCQELDIVVRGGGTYTSADQITVRASTWQRAWSIVERSSLVRGLYDQPVIIRGGLITINDIRAASPNDVIAVQTNTGLVPLLFQKRLTPVPLQDGENRLYFNTFWPAWDFVNLDTRAAAVTLIRVRAFPK